MAALLVPTILAEGPFRRADWEPRPVAKLPEETPAPSLAEFREVCELLLCKTFLELLLPLRLYALPFAVVSRD